MEKKDQCEMCGARPTIEVDGAIFCKSCAKKYNVYHCTRCGIRTVPISKTNELCNSCHAEDALKVISDAVWQKIDPLIFKGEYIGAVAEMFELVDPIEGEYIEGNIDRRDLLYARYRLLRKLHPEQFDQKTNEEYWSGYYS